MVLTCLCLAVFFVTVSFWSQCGELSLTRNFLPKWNKQFYSSKKYNFENWTYLCFLQNKFILIGDQQGESIQDIDCLINQEYTVSCKREGEEIYLPFSFLHEYFEIFGTLSTNVKGNQRFEWSHSNAKINYPKGTYDPRGIFMYFENYNVEVKFFKFCHFLCCLFLFYFFRQEIALNVLVHQKVFQYQHNGKRKDTFIQHKLHNLVYRIIVKT